MSDWTKPIDSGNNPFGPENIYDLLPPKDEIPTEFWHGRTKWNTLFNNWFFVGVSDLDFDLKDGIDGELMMSHIAHVMGSYAPKHEHKEAACAYLWSLWCNDVKYKTNERKN